MEPGYHKGNTKDNTITRPLTVLGPGYGMKRNIGSTSPVASAILTYSEGLVIDASDVHVAGLSARAIRVESGSTSNEKNNIVIERCKVSIISCSQYSNYITIKNNYVNEWISSSSCNYVSIIGNLIFGYVVLPEDNNALNNLCQYNTIISSSTECIYRGKNAIIKDNILINTRYPENVFNWDGTNEFRNNVLSVPSASAKEKFPNNYYVGATIENTFVNTTEGVWYDEAMKYQLLETSAAKNPILRYRDIIK